MKLAVPWSRQKNQSQSSCLGWHENWEGLRGAHNTGQACRLQSILAMADGSSVASPYGPLGVALVLPFAWMNAQNSARTGNLGDRWPPEDGHLHWVPPL